MSKASYSFSPALLLATGFAASPADAAIIETQLNINPITDTNKFYLTMTAQGVNAGNIGFLGYNYTWESYAIYTSSGKKTTYQGTVLRLTGIGNGYNQMTELSANPNLGVPTDPYIQGPYFTNLLQFYQGGSETRYSQLRFRLDGVDTYGVAKFVGNNLESIRYEIVDPADAVPEPAVWAELIAGFGLIGAMQRSRRPASRRRSADCGTA